MDRFKLSESDIRTKFITPALREAGWDIHSQIREEVTFTDGRIAVRGKVHSREEGKRADYILSYKPNVPVAVIEAKKHKYGVGGGMQQALDYAGTLGVPFAFSSNGEGFVFHDRTATGDSREVNLCIDDFPSPGELWRRYREWKGIDQEAERIVLQDYHDGGGEKSPRYYQVNAINSAVEAIAKGRDRVLLVMATGTGKTYVAFQIIWRLWKARTKKRILFLADRNVLINQTRSNDFRPFGGKMTRLSSKNVDPSYEVYLSLYQSITGPEERQKAYKEFSPGFFDLIVIDECHRGSASEDSAWREILEYFSSATQIGLTATPKETEYASNIDYFGDPVFSYSLKQGIQDGFLAPYKVVRVHIDRDVEGYRPEKGQLDRYGEEVEDRHYEGSEMERELVLDERTKLVASRVTQFLKESGERYQKSIIFCVDQEHASRMRQALVNQNADLVDEDDRYVMRITADDETGKRQLDNFIDPESKYPVLVTTSRLLSTGVDVRTCRLIVIDREVRSMTEFKQIVGRGTRVYEEGGKSFFTLIDFRGASNHFADPDFDGDPVQVYEPRGGDPMTPPDDSPQDSEGESESKAASEFSEPPEPFLGPGESRRRKVYIDGVPVEIERERVKYLDADGNLITESLRDYTKKLLLGRFASLDDFLRRWSEVERRKAILEEVSSSGFPLELVAKELGKEHLDSFDLICHLAFDAKPLTRRERAENVRKRDVFAKYGEKARSVLDALLSKYADEGILDLDDAAILRIPPLDALGTPLELIRSFGDKPGFDRAVRDLQSELYRDAG